MPPIIMMMMMMMMIINIIASFPVLVLGLHG
jgi:hypothetical protein